jgi:hypothetical protein
MGKHKIHLKYQVYLCGEPSCFNNVCINIYQFSEPGIRFAAWYHCLLRPICEEKTRECNWLQVLLDHLEITNPSTPQLPS